VVVSTLEPAPVREAEFFVSALAERRLHLGALVLNKTLPDYLLGAAGEEAARRLCRDPETAAAAAGDAQRGARGKGGDAQGNSLDQPTVSRVLHTVGESFLNFAVVAKREAELRAELAAAPDLILSVPYFETDVHDLAGLNDMGKHLFGS
jgi:hypothetical protein